MLAPDTNSSPGKAAMSAAIVPADPWLRYGVSLLIVLVISVARALLAPLLGESAPLLLFTLAVTLSAWYGGLGPGLLSTALSALVGNYFFIEPVYSLSVNDPRDWVRLGVFVVVGVVVSLLNHALRRAEQRAEANWFEARVHSSERQQAEESLSFLLEASSVLASSLDYEKTLAAVVQLAVPKLSDWCAVDVAEGNGKIRRLAIAHADTMKVEQAWKLDQLYPKELNDAEGVPKVISTGRSALYKQISEESLRRSAYDEEHLRLLRELGLRSAMIVPLVAGERIFGAITFVLAESKRFYDSGDLRFAEELARRIALAIENARLYRQAQESNRTKDEFLATLSHELRTPLTPIIGWAHMMQSGMLPEKEFAHGLTVINNNAQALTRLINDLLDMSAILSGKMRIDQTPLAISSAVQEAVEIVRPQATAHSITIDLRLEPDAATAETIMGAPITDAAPVMISGDRTRLVQVFWNLLSNAVKFSPQGGRVSVRCRATPREVSILIEDCGRGINPECLPHIFEHFRQADSSHTRLHGGLGLGLALVKTFVEAHHGTISATSAGENQGSCFTVVLPRLPQPQPLIVSRHCRRRGDDDNDRHDDQSNNTVRRDDDDSSRRSNRHSPSYDRAVTDCLYN